jgi:hypothetical protein
LNLEHITTLVLPAGLTYIGDHAFEGCFRLNATVVIPNGVSYIGLGAFAFTYVRLCCEADIAPDTWDPDWNVSMHRKEDIVWGYQIKT